MEKVRVFFDREGNTLSVWFDDPKKGHICEGSDDDEVLVNAKAHSLFPSQEATSELRFSAAMREINRT